MTLPHLMTGRLSTELWHALGLIKVVRDLPEGTRLFEEGTAVNGVYLVEAGEVRVLLPSSTGPRHLLEMAGPGTMLGLSESLSGGNYTVSAEASGQSTVSFIARADFAELMLGHVDYCMQIVRLLSEDLHGVYYKYRCIGAHPGRPRQRRLEEQLN